MLFRDYQLIFIDAVHCETEYYNNKINESVDKYVFLVFFI